MKNTWEQEEPKSESNQETPAPSKVETVEPKPQPIEGKFRNLPWDDDPNWEE